MRWRLGVVGSPISHSLTPQLHEATMARLALEGSSERVEMSETDDEVLRTLMHEHFDALSVTMPLKETAARICDERDEVAQRTGVVNSLLWRDGVLHGANTDGPGLLDSLAATFHEGVGERKVRIHGAGGAARGIVDALVHANVGAVVLDGRTAANVDRLTAKYERVFDSSHDLGHADFVINTQPAQASTPRAADVAGVDATTIALDITYEPRMSPWRQSYVDLGCRSANGLGMLAYQAARQMRWWFDRDVDGATLLAVIE